MPVALVLMSSIRQLKKARPCESQATVGSLAKS